MCSILTVDTAGLLHPMGGPSLPKHYSAALEGIAIGPMVGSCGTAAFYGEPVVVSDIATDPLWQEFKALALGAGLRACWSSPIKARDGRVVGTFAFYHRKPTGAGQLEQRIVTTCLNLCAIAIEHKEMQDRNHRLAYFDALTGLPNRGRFNELLGLRISEAAPFGLLFVDIDHLKAVNDGLGHVFGDRLIRTLGQRIQASAPHITAFRLGGDEFAVLVDDCESSEKLSRAADAVLAGAAGIVESEARTTSPSITIGGALFGIDGNDAQALYQNADFALHHAKETHRGGFVRFVAGLRSSMLDTIKLVQSVELALMEGRMLPHYQPIVRMDTGEIVGLEALARMRRTDGKIVSAGEFQPAMADPRLAYRLTDLMLASVARDIRIWLEAGLPMQHVGINVTTGDFQRGDLQSRIVDAFGAEGVPLRHIILEVNEAVYMGGEDRRVVKSIEALRKMGVLVALDDFGTGFASLTHLLSFPVDVIKIDKSFVDRLTVDTSSAVIVGSIIEIAAKLGMKVVAEGVETEEQAQALLGLGCKLGQGYLYSRPQAAAAVTTLLGSFAQKGPKAAPKRTSATQASRRAAS
ncbi:MAG: putative bifunctional diguanylate cyclase/phosphodiesterase [Cypionkella sp.]